MKNKTYLQGVSTGDEGRVINVYEELLWQVYRASLISQILNEYRHSLARKHKEYNAFNSLIDVSTRQFALLTLYKFFDPNSDITLEKITKWRKDPALNKWYKKELAHHQRRINNIKKWRDNFIAHLNQSVFESPKEFEKDYLFEEADLQKLKMFLVDYLCQLQFSIYRIDPFEKKKSYLAVIMDLTRFCHEQTRKTLTDYSLVFKNV